MNPTEEIPTPEGCVAQPLPRPIDTVSVVWVVLTPETLSKYTSQPGWAFMALTPKQYENISRNQAETTRWVTEAFAQLESYRDE